MAIAEQELFARMVLEVIVPARIDHGGSLGLRWRAAFPSMGKADMEKYAKEHFPKVKTIVEPFLTAPIVMKHCKVDETIPKKFVTAVAA